MDDLFPDIGNTEFGDFEITEFKQSKVLDTNFNTYIKSCLLYTSYFSGESILETGSISSKLAQFFIIDLVYTQVVKEKSAEVVERKIKTCLLYTS